MTNPTSSASDLPDELAPGRADFLRLATAVAGSDPDAIAQVLAELSCLHPAAWQLTLQAAARELIAALHVFADGNAQAVHAHLQSQAFAALDHAEVVADRHEGRPPESAG
jgi:hypothetical protein